MPAIEIVPHVTHDLAGVAMELSASARAEVARMIMDDEAYLYTPIGQCSMHNLWLNDTVDQRTGYKGVRIPLADWARAYEAERARDEQQQQQTA